MMLNVADRVRRRPKHARPLPSTPASDGWWYEGGRGVDVFVQSTSGGVVAVRIGWAELLRAAQRSSGREVIVRRERAK